MPSTFATWLKGAAQLAFVLLAMWLCRGCNWA
jgi:hypothetical protein